jgi:hypothetical protein
MKLENDHSFVGDTSAIAQQLINAGFEYDSADIVDNKFK